MADKMDGSRPTGSDIMDVGWWQARQEQLEQEIKDLDEKYRGVDSTSFRVKRGLSGYINGIMTSAFADTGSPSNIVSGAFAHERKLG